jgi:hypothetical protein
MRHGKGCHIGILRLYLTPSALGAAEDDKIEVESLGRKIVEL